MRKQILNLFSKSNVLFAINILLAFVFLAVCINAGFKGYMKIFEGLYIFTILASFLIIFSSNFLIKNILTLNFSLSYIYIYINKNPRS